MTTNFNDTFKYFLSIILKIILDKFFKWSYFTYFVSHKLENYDQYIHSLKNLLILKDESRFVAQQLLYLHKQAINRVDPIIVELGVGTGQSTKVFLNAIHEKKMLN